MLHLCAHRPSVRYGSLFAQNGTRGKKRTRHVTPAAGSVQHQEPDGDGPQKPKTNPSPCSKSNTTPTPGRGRPSHRPNPHHHFPPCTTRAPQNQPPRPTAQRRPGRPTTTSRAVVGLVATAPAHLAVSSSSSEAAMPMSDAWSARNLSAMAACTAAPVGSTSSSIMKYGECPVCTDPSVSLRTPM